MRGWQAVDARLRLSFSRCMAHLIYSIYIYISYIPLVVVMPGFILIAINATRCKYNKHTPLHGSMLLIRNPILKGLEEWTQKTKNNTDSAAALEGNEGNHIAPTASINHKIACTICVCVCVLHECTLCSSSIFGFLLIFFIFKTGICIQRNVYNTIEFVFIRSF